MGGRTLGRLDLEGELRAIGDVPGIFQAPVWVADGRMIYAAADGDRQALVVRDGAAQEELVPFEGSIEFVASPRGERVAYRIDDGEGLRGVEVVDVASSRSQTVTESPTLAFHWSPDGRTALAADGGGERRARGHRWLVWDGQIRRAGRIRVRPDPHVPA